MLIILGWQTRESFLPLNMIFGCFLSHFMLTGARQKETEQTLKTGWNQLQCLTKNVKHLNYSPKSIVPPVLSNTSINCRLLTTYKIIKVFVIKRSYF